MTPFFKVSQVSQLDDRCVLSRKFHFCPKTRVFHEFSLEKCLFTVVCPCVLGVLGHQKGDRLYDNIDILTTRVILY